MSKKYGIDIKNLGILANGLGSMGRWQPVRKSLLLFECYFRLQECYNKDGRRGLLSDPVWTLYLL